MRVSSEEYDDVQEISRMTTGGSGGESDETPRPRKKKKLTLKEPSRPQEQDPAPEELRRRSLLCKQTI